MSYNMLRDVQEFHKKFDLPTERYPGFPSDEILEFRKKFLREELNEFEEAVKNKDLVKVLDALADLVYVALGTAIFMNLPFQDAWNIVHNANMTKIKARSSKDSKRSSIHDVIKPPNWTPPDMMIHSAILAYEYKLKVGATSVGDHDED